MTIEIRPVTRDEAVDYLRVLPFANGLPMWEPAPAAWHSGHGPGPRPPAPKTDDELETYAASMLTDGFHPQAAFVDGRIVGASAMLSLELTVPGPRQVALGGVTATGVIATHRRRGLLRGLMTAMFAEARDRGEFLAGLSASEGSIYGRYGFSPATFQVRWELERSEAAFAETVEDPGGLELVGAAVATEIWPGLHERVRRGRVGEVSAWPTRWRGLSDASDGADGPLRYLIHRDPDGVVDGAVNFRLPWSADPALAGTLQVETFEAATPAAYRSLWALLTDFDLTRRVVAGRRPPDEPLPWMLANPRALRVSRQSDNLWLRILDVDAALAARGYAGQGTLVLAVTDPDCPWNDRTWRLETGPDGGRCEPTHAAADLTVAVSTLGSLYLGGVSPATLAAAGRIAEHRPGAVAELDRLFRQDPRPSNTVGF